MLNWEVTLKCNLFISSVIPQYVYSSDAPGNHFHIRIICQLQSIFCIEHNYANNGLLIVLRFSLQVISHIWLRVFSRKWDQMNSSLRPTNLPRPFWTVCRQDTHVEWVVTGPNECRYVIVSHFSPLKKKQVWPDYWPQESLKKQNFQMLPVNGN